MAWRRLAAMIDRAKRASPNVEYLCVANLGGPTMRFFHSASSRSRHNRVRPAIEDLEDRCTPSVGVGSNPREVTVMSQNLYVGADLTPVVAATIGGDPLAIISEVTSFWAHVQVMNFPDRA